jgi:hypothetical protein
MGQENSSTNTIENMCKADIAPLLLQKPWSLEITALQVVDTSDAAAVPVPASFPVAL